MALDFCSHSLQKERGFIFRTTRRGWVHYGVVWIKMSFTLQRAVQKRNISPRVLQNPVRQAQFSETNFPASLNLVCKSKRIILVRPLKSKQELHTQLLWINSNAYGVSFWADRKRPLQKNIDEDIGRGPQFLWDFLPPSRTVDTCIQQATSGPLHETAITATFSSNVFNVFFPWSCFVTDICSFLQNWYGCFANF